MVREAYDREFILVSLFIQDNFLAIDIDGVR